MNGRISESIVVDKFRVCVGDTTNLNDMVVFQSGNCGLIGFRKLNLVSTSHVWVGVLNISIHKLISVEIVVIGRDWRLLGNSHC